MNDHTYYMKQALELAQKAQKNDEVPVGALIVHNNKIIAKAHNQKEEKKCSIYHAEIAAIKQAAKALNNWRLSDCYLYVTLEPCIMCAGAIYQSRIKTVVFATKDPKGGALGSLYNISNDTRLNHKIEIIENICQKECSDILKEFFQNKRKNKNSTT
jgi:tRNA(adenine34) deaminase